MSKYTFEFDKEIEKNNPIPHISEAENVKYSILEHFYDINNAIDGYACGSVKVDMQYLEDKCVTVDGIDFFFSLDTGINDIEDQMDAIHAFYEFIRVEYESRGWKFWKKPKKH